MPIESHPVAVAMFTGAYNKAVCVTRMMTDAAVKELQEQTRIDEHEITTEERTEQAEKASRKRKRCRDPEADRHQIPVLWNVDKDQDPPPLRIPKNLTRRMVSVKEAWRKEEPGTLAMRQERSDRKLGWSQTN